MSPIRYAETGRSTLLGQPPRSMEALNKSGAIFPVHLSISRVDNASGMHFMGVIRPESTQTNATVVIDAFGRIKSVSKPVLSLFGYRNCSDLEGKNVQMLMNPKIDHDAILHVRSPPPHCSLPHCVSAIACVVDVEELVVGLRMNYWPSCRPGLNVGSIPTSTSMLEGSWDGGRTGPTSPCK